MKRLFLTGGTSLLGAGLIANKPQGWDVIIAEHQRQGVFPKTEGLETVSLDVTSKNQTNNLIKKYSPSIVVHAAALSDVDYCEKNQKEAWAVNVVGTINIVSACEKIKAPLIFISSNAVFDGSKGRYTEEDKPNPVNFYGRTKYEGEKIVKGSFLSWTIIRLITMYGWPPPRARQNPVTWIIVKLKRGEKIKIVEDTYLNPLYNHDAARVVWTIIKKGQPRNIYHVAGNEIVNRYQWAQEVARVFRLNLKLISPVSSSFFGNKIAPRPLRTVYSIKKIREELNFIPRGIKAGLRAMKKEEKKSVFFVLE